MAQALRRAGIAIGSVVAAWLVLTLVGGAFGLSANAGLIGVVAVIVLGALIYRDILGRRSRPD